MVAKILGKLMLFPMWTARHLVNTSFSSLSVVVNNEQAVLPPRKNLSFRFPRRVEALHRGEVVLQIY